MRVPIFQFLKPASIFDIRVPQFFQGLFRATCATTGSSVKNQFSGLVFGDFANPFRDFRVWNPNCITKMARIPFFLRTNVNDEFLRSCLRRVTLLSGISIGLLRFVDLSCVRCCGDGGSLLLAADHDKRKQKQRVVPHDLH